MLKSESGVENSDPVEKTHQITCVAFVHEIIWRLCLLSLSRDRVNKLQLQLTPHFIKKTYIKFTPCIVISVVLTLDETDGMILNTTKGLLFLFHAAEKYTMVRKTVNV